MVRRPIKRLRSSRLLRDLDIRLSLRAHLRRRYPKASHTRIIEEFSCIGARADIAVVNGRLLGFEIKSARDSLERLESQVVGYNAVFDRVTLVADKKHIGRLPDYIPDWWGILEARARGDSVAFRLVRESTDNPRRNRKALAKLLWRREAWHVLRIHGLRDGLHGAPATRLWKKLASRLPLEILAREVRQALKVRDDSESARRRTQSDGSFPIESTAAHYQKNLSWLLSLQSPRPQR